jgi:hypothetical protein
VSVVHGVTALSRLFFGGSFGTGCTCACTVVNALCCSPRYLSESVSLVPESSIHTRSGWAPAFCAASAPLPVQAVSISLASASMVPSRSE